ncbi:MAG: hypothetical protein Q4E68_00560 [Prevotellaceae bacterium]|nr:hypothetical protein [Prevotellaceae bacterium]
MKKSLLFLFLLVLGVTQGWAQVYETLPTGSATLKENAVYRVESTTKINGTLSVPLGKTVTIYIAKGKNLTIRGAKGSNRTTPGKPAIEVPSETTNNVTVNSTLIITGGGTLRVYGGNAYAYATTAGGSGAAPAIGGIGGNGGSDRKDGSDGAAMGNVYIRGNVTVRVA